MSLVTRVDDDRKIAEVMAKPEGDDGPWIQTTVAMPDYDPVDGDPWVRVIVWVQPNGAEDKQVHMLIDPHTGEMHVDENR